MKKFLLTYWTGIALLFGLFYWDLSPFSQSINHLQTEFTTFLTSLSLNEGMMFEHRITITDHYGLVIEKACNGIIPYLFFLASILAFPSTLLHKIKWAIMGYLFISAMNVFRIWFVTQLVLKERNNFSLAHDYLGNGLLILTGLLLFTWFVKSRKKRELIIEKNFNLIHT
jgi:exosortase/archaeosortase family protein